jgi:hypothetical protein
MSIIINQIKASDPTADINKIEFEHTFLSFCTCACLINNKKLNLAKIFIVLLDNPNIRKAMLKATALENEWLLLRKFLEYEPTLHKSKYIKNYINESKIPLKI